MPTEPEISGDQRADNLACTCDVILHGSELFSEEPFSRGRSGMIGSASALCFPRNPVWVNSKTAFRC